MIFSERMVPISTKDTHFSSTKISQLSLANLCLDLFLTETFYIVLWFLTTTCKTTYCVNCRKWESLIDSRGYLLDTVNKDQRAGEEGNCTNLIVTRIAVPSSFSDSLNFGLFIVSFDCTNFFLNVFKIIVCFRNTMNFVKYWLCYLFAKLLAQHLLNISFKNS